MTSYKKNYGDVQFITLHGLKHKYLQWFWTGDLHILMAQPHRINIIITVFINSEKLKECAIQDCN